MLLDVHLRNGIGNGIDLIRAAGCDRRTSGDAHRRTASVRPGGVSRGRCGRLDRPVGAVSTTSTRRSAASSPADRSSGGPSAPQLLEHLRTERAARCGPRRPSTVDAEREALVLGRIGGRPQRRGDRPRALRGADHRPIADPRRAPEARRPVTTGSCRARRRASGAAAGESNATATTCRSAGLQPELLGARRAGRPTVDPVGLA